MLACPDSSALQAFAEGVLAEGSATTLRAHALGCAACLDLLVALHSTSGAPSATPASAPQPPPAPLPLPGRFRPLRRLGQGGMGVVYEALDLQLGRVIAVKTLRALTPAALLRFKGEFRALQDLHHEHLVAVGELVEDQGRWAFTMERVEGVDLLSYVRPDGALDPARLRGALLQLAAGLHYLHGAGKVHRDIKPRNVLVTAAGRLVLLDLGLVAEGPPAYGPREIVGTTPYMAPEQAAGQPPSPAADWYAVGVVLHQALTGRLPAGATGPAGSGGLDPALADLHALCAALLDRDPARRPASAEVLRRLAAPVGPAPVVVPPEQGQAFVGRAAELRDLAEVFAAPRGAARAVVVTGESGVGKSELVRQAAARFAAESPALLVLTGRCYEREWAPYKAMDGVMAALGGALALLPGAEAAALLPADAGLLPQTFPALGRVPGLAWPPPPQGLEPHEARGRLFRALRELLARLARRRPLLLLIDDLHWADEDSLALLGATLGRSASPPLLLLGTAQDTDAGRERVQALAEGLDLRALALGPLPLPEACELARRLLAGRAAGPDPAALAAEAGGHPLFLAELSRHAGAGRAPGGTPRLTEVLWGRIDALEPRARWLLRLVALSSAPLPEEVAVRAGALDGAGLLREVSLLRGGGLLRTVATGPAQALLSYHDRVREVVVAHTPAAERTDLHRALAVALEGWGQASADSLMEHWEGAGELPRAAGYAAQAARIAAAALAFGRAAELYRRALALHPAHAPDEAQRLREGLGDALASAGHGPEAAEALRAAAGGVEGERAARLRQRAAELLLLAGELQQGTAAYEEIVRAAGLRMARTPGRTLLSLLVGRARLRWRGLGFTERPEADAPAELLRRADLCWSVAMAFAYFDVLRGADFQVRHLRYALEAGEPYRVSRALSMEAGYLAALGGPAARRKVPGLLAQARAAAARGGHPHGLALADMADGDVAFQEGRWSEALRLCGAAEARYRAECRGVAAELDNCSIFSCMALYHLGQLRELARRRDENLREARERRDAYLVICLLTGFPVIALVRGDVAGAASELAQGMAEARRVRTPLLLLTELLPLVQIDLYEGDGPRAQRRMEQAEREHGGELRMGLRIRSFRVQLRTSQGICALAAAHAVPAGPTRERLLRRAALVARRLAAEGTRSAAALGSLLGAGVAAARGDGDAPARLLAAAMALEASELRLFAAAARLRAAALLGGERGAAGAAAGLAFMTAEDVREPARLGALFVPG